MMRRTLKSETNAEVLEPRQPVLIVDNGSFLADSFRMTLVDAGFVIETALTGEEALSKADSIHFKLVIANLNPPDITGAELSKKLKEKIPRVNVVLIGRMNNIEKVPQTMAPSLSR